MQRFVLFLLFAAIGCSPRQSGKVVAVTAIFREVTIGRSLPLDTIALGHLWSSAAKYGAADADTAFALPFGTFGGADAIEVSRDSRGVVTAIIFAYHQRRDPQSLLSEYRESLGPPVDVHVDTAGRTVRTTTIWRDAATEFTFVIQSPPGADAVGAMALLANRPRTSR